MTAATLLSFLKATCQILLLAVPVYYLLGKDDWQVARVVAEEYFYTISQLIPHKNFPTLVKVMAEIKKNHPELPQKLYISGISGNGHMIHGHAGGRIGLIHRVIGKGGTREFREGNRHASGIGGYHREQCGGYPLALSAVVTRSCAGNCCCYQRLCR